MANSRRAGAGLNAILLVVGIIAMVVGLYIWPIGLAGILFTGFSLTFSKLEDLLKEARDHKHE